MSQVKSLRTGIKFKDTPIGKIPVDWEVRKLGDISEVRRGASPRPINDSKWFGGNFGWVRISDVTSSKKYLRRTKDYLSDEGVKKSVRIKRGEVILSICATIGRPIIVDMDACIHDGFVWFDGLKDDIDREFFYYFWNNKENVLASQRQTGTQGNLNTSIISNSYIPLPPFPEQRKIAEILTTVDDAIEETDSIIEKTKELKSGLLQKFITCGIDEKGKIRNKKTHEFKNSPVGKIPIEWESPCLEDTCSLVTNGYVGPTRELYRKSGIPYLVSKNIRPNAIIKEAFAFVDEKFQQANKRSILYKGDVLTVQTGAIGDTCVVPKEFEGANCHALIISRPIPERLNSFWLSEYFNSPIGKKEFSRIATGLAHPHLNSTFVRKLTIPIPPKNEQDKIVKILLTLNDEINSEKDYQQKLETLKKSLMQILLTGKIRVKLH